MAKWRRRKPHFLLEWSDKPLNLNCQLRMGRNTLLRTKKSYESSTVDYRNCPPPINRGRDRRNGMDTREAGLDRNACADTKSKNIWTDATRHTALVG